MVLASPAVPAAPVAFVALAAGTGVVGVVGAEGMGATIVAKAVRLAWSLSPKSVAMWIASFTLPAFFLALKVISTM